MLGVQRTVIPFEVRSSMSTMKIVLHNGELVMDILEKILCHE